MRTYHTSDGAVIEASDARDVVRKLRAMSNTPEQNIQTFMEEVAERVLLQGKVISTNTPTQFVAGLLEAGLLTKEVQ